MTETLLPETAVTVPDRPALAPNVRLLGELPGTGFVDRQWLAQRDDKFIQLTELLYRVAEHADGRRTAAEVAAQLTAESEWLIEEDDVRRLIATRLAPLGLIEVASPKSSVAASASPPSPLAVNLHMKTIGPRVIDPVTRVLQYLFWPPILVVALVAAIGAHIWLYRAHGFLGAVIDALYTPGFVLILLGLVLLGAVVHEFGHASALRYGGGRARKIGAGFYLVFPAFFTDVTDSYRLSRWARVRTGLGGVYFHLLFALALIGLSQALGQEFLLLGVFLINMEIVRQFIPIVRLDGYWVLADVSGIPDFFSQAAPFIRSLLPADRFPGSRLPRLKWSAKAVFLSYLAVTIPLLGFFVYLIVRFLPRIATTIWDAVATQSALFGEAHGSADVIGMATAAAEIAILALASIGTAYMLYVLASKPLVFAWRQPTLARRSAGLAAVAGVLAAIGFFWAPQLPFSSEAPPAGVQTFAVSDRTHVTTHVDYAQSPPVGGPHAPVWQNCGFYARPVRPENAVHSLEHGAVWITYRQSLPADQISALRKLADSESYVLVSPYTGLPAPLVASAWGRQLRLTSVRDARLERFVHAFRHEGPERGGLCSGGRGKPL